MKLTDIIPLDKWIELEKEINARFNLNASVFDAMGNRITDFNKWANSLCPVVKANENGKRFICAAAHQVIAAEATQTKKPAIETCDAGLIKLVVPVFLNETFMGVVGGCGLLRGEEEVDRFLIHKITGIEMEEIDRLTKDIGVIEADQIDSAVEYIQQEVNHIHGRKTRFS
ncbi:MAG: PocR ligand-binding domain-containing protein [Deltaproteobacteria bacterium]|nr:PocR ligand-binding domain-containing protein [Deltaproteobacteria bacterium]MBW2152863.1 PocR ligand-binding domain-containing protein [Deltaproteobacteria bacterium]